jgi:hypothetical protein
MTTRWSVNAGIVVMACFLQVGLARAVVGCTGHALRM